MSCAGSTLVLRTATIIVVGLLASVDSSLLSIYGCTQLGSYLKLVTRTDYLAVALTYLP